MIDLLIEDERGNIIKHQLGDGKHILGKSASSDVMLMDTFASRNHAELIVSNDTVFVIDTNSKNGVVFMNRRIKKNLKLKPGQSFNIGNLKLSLKKPLFKLFVKAGRKITNEQHKVDISKLSTIDEKVTALLQC